MAVRCLDADVDIQGAIMLDKKSKDTSSLELGAERECNSSLP